MPDSRRAFFYNTKANLKGVIPIPCNTMPVKVRFFYAVGPTDYRGLYKANVA